MGKNNRQRRATKAKQRKTKQRQRNSTVVGSVAHSPFPAPVIDSGMNRLLATTQKYGLSTREEPDWVQSTVDALITGCPDYPRASSATELESIILDNLTPPFMREQFPSTYWTGLLLERTIEAAVRRSRGAEDEAGRLEVWFLLNGLASLVPEPHATDARKAADTLRKHLSQTAVDAAPSWIGTPPAPTGETWVTANGYGDEFGLFAAVTDPTDDSTSVYAWNFDDSRYNHVTFAGPFADLDAATAAWAAHVGEDTADSRPVTKGDQIAFADYREDPFDVPNPVEGDLMRREFFRSERRLSDLASALRKRGVTLPTPRNLYSDVDLEPVITEFRSWCERQGVTESEYEEFAVIVDDWLGGAAPGTEFSISPKRIEHRCILLADGYIQDYAKAAFTVLPHWYRFCAERTALPDSLAERAIASAPTTQEEARERDRRNGPDED